MDLQLKYDTQDKPDISSQPKTEWQALWNKNGSHIQEEQTRNTDFPFNPSQIFQWLEIQRMAVQKCLGKNWPFWILLLVSISFILHQKNKNNNARQHADGEKQRPAQDSKMMQDCYVVGMREESGELCHRCSLLKQKPCQNP